MPNPNGYSESPMPERSECRHPEENVHENQGTLEVLLCIGDVVAF
jgi:hypothetical protein